MWLLIVVYYEKKPRMKLNQRRGWMRNWWFSLPEIVTAPANNTIEWRMSLSIPIVCQVCECTRVRSALCRVLTFTGQGDAKCSSQKDPVNRMWKHWRPRHFKKHLLMQIHTDTFCTHYTWKSMQLKVLLGSSIFRKILKHNERSKTNAVCSFPSTFCASEFRSCSRLCYLVVDWFFPCGF